MRTTVPTLPIAAAWIVLQCGFANAQWHVESVATPGRVIAIETDEAAVKIRIGNGWYELASTGKSLKSATAPAVESVPSGALPHARVARGREIDRAWLADPTDRYRHGVLGDAIEAGSLVIERRDGSRGIVRLDADSVFEDITPRIAVIGGHERIVLVRSYLTRGSALAIVDPKSAAIVAETPPIGRPNAWLNPAGIADFDGDGAIDIAFVRQPHVVGRLEIWSWRSGALSKITDMPDVSNHAIGSRALGLSAVADFDGDGRPDLAVPALDRRSMRLISFAPKPHDIAKIPLPAAVTTNLGTIRLGGRLAIVAGLEDGQLILVRE